MCWPRRRSSRALPSPPEAGEENVRLFRDADDAWGLARALDTLGELARWLEEDAQAEALYVESMALYWRMGDDRGLAINLLNRAGLALKRGDPRQASGFLQETGSLCRRLRWEIGLAYCLVGLGAVATLQEQSERAIRLFSAVEALFNNRGHRMQPADRALYDVHLVLARARLDATQGAAAWAAGQALTLEQALEGALGPEALSAPAQAEGSGPTPSGARQLAPVRPRAGAASTGRHWRHRPPDRGGLPDGR
jgi:hypothetical protein